MSKWEKVLLLVSISLVLVFVVWGGILYFSVKESYIYGQVIEDDDDAIFNSSKTMTSPKKESLSIPKTINLRSRAQKPIEHNDLSNDADNNSNIFSKETANTIRSASDDFFPQKSVQKSVKSLKGKVIQTYIDHALANAEKKMELDDLEEGEGKKSIRIPQLVAVLERRANSIPKYAQLETIEGWVIVDAAKVGMVYKSRPMAYDKDSGKLGVDNEHVRVKFEDERNKADFISDYPNLRILKSESSGTFDICVVPSGKTSMTSLKEEIMDHPLVLSAEIGYVLYPYER